MGKSKHKPSSVQVGDSGRSRFLLARVPAEQRNPKMGVIYHILSKSLLGYVNHKPFWGSLGPQEWWPVPKASSSATPRCASVQSWFRV